MPLGMGCHHEGQAAFHSGAPTRLGRSCLNSCLGFLLCYFLLLLLSLKKPVLHSGWGGAGGGVRAVPSQSADSAGSLTGSHFVGRVGALPTQGRAWLLARPRPPCWGFGIASPSAWPWRPLEAKPESGALPSAWPWRPAGAEPESRAASPSCRATVSRGAAALP